MLGLAILRRCWFPLAPLPPATPFSSTHFICRVRLRCSGVLLLTGMW